MIDLRDKFDNSWGDDHWKLDEHVQKIARKYNLVINPARNIMNFGKFEEEYYFNLGVAFCHRCQMVQLTELVERERMFHENYAYFSSTSTYMANHFSQLAQNVIDRYLNSPAPFVLEIGSNDGIMLQHFMNSGIRHLGVEPSSNVAQVAIGQGVETISDFFDDDLNQPSYGVYLFFD